MDKQIEKATWTKQRLMYLVIGLAIAILLFFGFKQLNKKIYKLDADRMITQTVIQGNFQDVILIDAFVECMTLGDESPPKSVHQPTSTTSMQDSNNCHMHKIMFSRKHCQNIFQK